MLCRKQTAQKDTVFPASVLLPTSYSAPENAAVLLQEDAVQAEGDAICRLHLTVRRRHPRGQVPSQTDRTKTTIRDAVPTYTRIKMPV